MLNAKGSEEIIYAANSTATSETNESISHVMSDKVQMIASVIYKEFEALIQKFGPDSVKDLMPLVVNVLENLDLSYLEKEEHAVDLEMLKEENEQLLNQYERERQTRKETDQKCMEIEENLIEQNRELESKISSLESIVRMLELRAKNVTDHANRLEDRENDHKLEFEKLHERYNELLKTHVDHVERTKFLMGQDMFEMSAALPKSGKTDGNSTPMVMSAINANKARGISDLIGATHMSQSVCPSLDLASHITDEERDWQEEFGQDQSAAEILATPRNQENILSARTKKVSNDDDETTEDEGGNKFLRVNDANDENADGISLTGGLVDPAEFASAVNDAFIGMGREVENLIRENNELLETKNALNIVKDDLIAQVDQLASERNIYKEEVLSLEMVKIKLTERMRELESEIKELKERNNELQEKLLNDEEEGGDPEDGLPSGQKKRFTRIEMQRVLLERNQYKERFMELQETMKFTESQRAQKIRTNSQQNKGTIWQFFSSLFNDSSSNNASSTPQRKQRLTANAVTSGRSRLRSKDEKIEKRNLDLDFDLVHERRMNERRQQYKSVSEHIKHEDEPHAYGWSLSAALDAVANSNLSIPVPVCCRPLFDKPSSLKIWCAASARLHGGRTMKDGNFIAGNELLSCDPTIVSTSTNTTGSEKVIAPSTLHKSSSLVWICSSNERRSFVTILDANYPNHVIDTFAICCSHILCVGAVEGIKAEEIENLETEGSIDKCTDEFAAKLNTDGGYISIERIPAELSSCQEMFGTVNFVRLRRSEVEDNIPTYCSVDEQNSPKRARDFSLNQTSDSNAEDDEDGQNPTPSTSAAYNISLHIREALNKYEQIGENTTALPTMWMGMENDYIYIHSSVVEWRRCLRRIKMSDAVLHILHTSGRIFAALANGSIAVFYRSSRGDWSDIGYHLIQLGLATSSVCYLAEVSGKIWAAFRNCIVIIDPSSLHVEHVFVAHPRRDSQVRQLLPVERGVWVSIRLDSTIRLYHAKTHQHLQDLDIEPFITKMLGTNKLDLMHLRITSLSELNRRIWIGTGTGIIVSIPLNEESEKKIKNGRHNLKGKTPGSLVRVHDSSTSVEENNGDDVRTTDITTEIIPYCSLTQAQLSFHGHKDAVRFLLPVLSEGISTLTEQTETKKALMMAGGDGYIDFRLGEDEEDSSVTDQHGTPIQQKPKPKGVRVRDMSHLIIWEVECQSDKIAPSTRD